MIVSKYIIHFHQSYVFIKFHGIVGKYLEICVIIYFKWIDFHKFESILIYIIVMIVCHFLNHNQRYHVRVFDDVDNFSSSRPTSYSWKSAFEQTYFTKHIHTYLHTLSLIYIFIFVHIWDLLTQNIVWNRIHSISVNNSVIIGITDNEIFVIIE